MGKEWIFLLKKLFLKSRKLYIMKSYENLQKSKYSLADGGMEMSVQQRI